MTNKIDDRISSVNRKTNETDIKVKINLDGIGKSQINTLRSKTELGRKYIFFLQCEYSNLNEI